MNSAHNPNRSLIRIFCLSLSGLLAVYRPSRSTACSSPKVAARRNLAIGVLRIALGLVAVGVLLRWGWFDAPLERQVSAMGASVRGRLSPT